MEKTKILTDSELQKIAYFLQKDSGISLDEQKLQRFRGKIEEIVKKYSHDDFHNFYHRLRFLNDQHIKQDLINAITVNETYFWRESEQFFILCDEILPKIIGKKNMPKVRILVSPSSSGEELYSIMLAILNTKGLLEKAYIELVGIDIDSMMITKAKKGLYDKRSVSKLPQNLLEKYFTKEKNYYKIDETLKQSATFLQKNIFDLSLEKELGKFDIIFSRNMLIYFNLEDKKRCYEQFDRLLKEDGYLFLGHADSNNIDKSKFKPILAHSYVFQKS